MQPSTTQIPAPQATFQQFASEWFETYVRTNNKPSEQKTKRLLLARHLIPWFGAQTLAEIGTVDVEKFKAYQLAHGLSAKSVNNHLAVLSKCLHTAVDWNVLTTCPRIKFLRAISQRLDFLGPEETKRLLDDAAEPMWNGMTRVALRTGMRLGEIFGLDWSDINLARRLVSVRRSAWCGTIQSPKNNRERHVPMTGDLGELFANAEAGRGLVFSRDGTTPLSHSSAQKALRRMCTRAGVRHVGWHTLRHTFASELAAKGAPIPAIKELLGHATIAMTMRYAHLAPSTLRSTISLLEPRDPAGHEVERCGQPVGNAGTISP